MEASRTATVTLVVLVTTAVTAVVLAAGRMDAGPPAAGVSASPPPQAASVSPVAPSAAPSAAAAPTTPASPAPMPPVLGALDADEALELATRLAAAGPRPAGSEADRQARSVVAGELRAAGWSVVQRHVPLPQGGATANVVATLSGTRVTGRPHVVVGAHLDTVAGSPGANDNASGVAVLVAVADELRDEAAALPLPVAFVLFGAEEYQPSSPRRHHVGSEAYAADHAEDVVAMLSVDMVGNGPATCVCWFAAGPPTLAEQLGSVAERAGISDVRVERRGDISDHGPFARRGVPAAFLWSYEDPAWHQPTDTADRLDVTDLRRAGDLVLAWLRDLPAGGDPDPRAQATAAGRDEPPVGAGRGGS